MINLFNTRPSVLAIVLNTDDSNTPFNGQYIMTATIEGEDAAEAWTTGHSRAIWSNGFSSDSRIEVLPIELFYETQNSSGQFYHVKRQW